MLTNWQRLLEGVPGEMRRDPSDRRASLGSSQANLQPLIIPAA
jgi:hypothetical protein